MSAAGLNGTMNIAFDDQYPEGGDIRGEVLEGLAQSQKQINPKFFYDQRGSELFDQITQQPEYYPTRTEAAILRRHRAEIADYCGEGCVVIEPGSGSSEKVRLLLEALAPSAYVPLDISSEFLQQAVLKLGEEFPWLQIHAICADFASDWSLPEELPAGKRIVFYPGSTIGNLEPSAAAAFLKRMRQWMRDGGAMLVGVDLHKSTERLNAAYNDASGVTADFNLNLLRHLGEVLDAGFDLDKFRHRAFYDESRRRIEMHLESKVSHVVRGDGVSFEFAEGETIHTENSYKYTLDSFTELAATAGFTVQRSWLDEDALFSVNYLVPAA